MKQLFSSNVAFNLALLFLLATSLACGSRCTNKLGCEDTCKYAQDNICDEPDVCEAGTDYTDCSSDINPLSSEFTCSEIEGGCTGMQGCQTENNECFLLENGVRTACDCVQDIQYANGTGTECALMAYDRCHGTSLLPN